MTAFLRKTMLYDLISIVLAAALIAWAVTLPARRHRRLLQRGVKVQGRLYSVERIWIQPVWHYPYNYKLHAGFVYEGKACEMLEKRSRKPAYRAGDSVEICLDPENPDICMIVDAAD